jgi:hypothetical protein
MVSTSTSQTRLYTRNISTTQSSRISMNQIDHNAEAFELTPSIKRGPAYIPHMSTCRANTDADWGFQHI